MSVQLVLYPQNYTGYSFSASPIINEYVSDSLLNGSFAISPSGVLGCTYAWDYNLITGGGSPFSNPNLQWLGFYTNSLCQSWHPTSAPTMSGSVLTLYSSAGTSQVDRSLCGVWQTVTGLTSGADYILKITHDNPVVTSGNGHLMIGFGATPGLNQIGNGISLPISAMPSTSYTEYSFTASNSSMELLIIYVHNQDNNIKIQEISINEDEDNPPLAFNDIHDGQVICDLYDEQNIPLSLSVDDFKNVIEKPQSYSKDFNLPNTKRNNKIFTHIFDVNKVIASTYDFNPYAKTKAVLKEDGLLIFEGYLKLLNIKEEEGEISYNVNLYSDVVSLADTLKDRTFNDLRNTLTELSHNYSRSNILGSWNTNGLTLTYALPANSFAGTAGTTATDVLKYPFVNWIGEYVDATGANNNATIGYTELIRLEDAFRPFVKVKYFIDIIFNAAGFEYTSSFFDSAEFDKLFMDMNWGVISNPLYYTNSSWNNFMGSAGAATAGTSYTQLQQDQPASAPWFSLPLQYDTSTDILTATADLVIWDVEYSWIITNTHSSAVDCECQWLHNSGQIVYSGIINIPASGTFTFSGNFSQMVSTGDTLQAQFKGSVAAVLTVGAGDGYGLWTRTVTAANAGTVLNTIRGDINQWEFLQGIIKMFNLVTMPDASNPQNILIEPYPDVFGESPTVVTPTERDWTEKVDVSKMEIKPVQLKDKITLKYEEDENDYCSTLYKSETKVDYGSKEIETAGMLGLTGNMTSLMEGEEEIVATPFAATVCKPLSVQWADFIVPNAFGFENGDYKKIDNLPRILYNNGIHSLNGGVTYYIPDQNGGGSVNQPDFLQFSHLSAIQPTVADNDFNFGQCQLIGIDPAPPSNLSTSCDGRPIAY